MGNGQVVFGVANTRHPLIDNLIVGMMRVAQEFLFFAFPSEDEVRASAWLHVESSHDFRRRNGYCYRVYITRDREGVDLINEVWAVKDAMSGDWDLVYYYENGGGDRFITPKGYACSTEGEIVGLAGGYLLSAISQDDGLESLAAVPSWAAQLKKRSGPVPAEEVLSAADLHDPDGGPPCCAHTDLEGK